MAKALRANREYDHYKGKQWWRACDNKSFQDMWIVKGRGPGKTKGEWGLADVIAKVPANENWTAPAPRRGTPSPTCPTFHSPRSPPRSSRAWSSA